MKMLSRACWPRLALLLLTATTPASPTRTVYDANVSGAAGAGGTGGATAWPDASASSGAGGFDIDGDQMADFVIGSSPATPTVPPILYRGSVTGPTAVSGGLASLHASQAIGVSDNDGDGRPDFLGAVYQSGDAELLWAGSDGTTSPPAVRLYLSDANATFTGQFAR
jgi:hypothetical protein